MTTRPSHPLAPWLLPVRDRLRALLLALPAPLAEFILFGLKMAWACLFGASLLALLLLTHLIWPAQAVIARYDFLVIAAVAIQILMLATRLEKPEEAVVIGLYHVIGTGMELFKTQVGSWSYPEPGFFKIGAVPLFTGFMYASVGSFIARALRIMDMRFSRYPPLWATLLLSALIYVNFFSHHYVWDLRPVLFGLCLVLFWRTRIFFTVDQQQRSMPFLLANLLTAGFLWLAENIGTFSHTWSYRTQAGWTWVSLQKLGAWALLLVISFVLVSLVIRPKAPHPDPAG